MNKMLFSLFLAGLWLLPLFGNGQNPETTRTYYASALITANGAMYMDIGDSNKAVAYSVLDDYGNPLKTGGLVQALNFLQTKGWELVTVDDHAQTVYILKKSIPVSKETNMRTLLLDNLNVRQHGGDKNTRRH